MIPAASNTSFAIVFTVFVVVTVVLVVLVLRFTLQRAAASRDRWLADQEDDEDDDELGPVTALVLVLSYRPARNLLSREQLMNYSFDPLRLVSTYGAFGSIVITSSSTSTPAPGGY